MLLFFVAVVFFSLWQPSATIHFRVHQQVEDGKGSVLFSFTIMHIGTYNTLIFFVVNMSLIQFGPMFQFM